MIAEIIPTRRMPKELSYLDYAIPNKLKSVIKKGQLVKIPLRNKEIFGIVKKIKKTSNGNKVKNIIDFVHKDSLISEDQLNFLEEISLFYKTPLGFLTKNNLLPLQKRKLKKITEINSLKKRVAKRKNTKPILDLYSNKKERLEKILKYIPKTGQVLILTSELSDPPNLLRLLPENLLKETLLINSNLSEKTMFDFWLDIWSGKKRIIIGTRRALLLPWINLKTIILDDESNPNHKSFEMLPKFHNRDAVIFLGRQHKAQVYLLGHTPSVETFFFAKNNVYINKEKKLPKVNIPEIINMKDERKKKNFSCLSEEVMDKLKRLKNGDCFLFLNRLGTSNYISCADCSYIFSCQKCKKSLTYSEQRNFLRCGQCKQEYEMTANCPACKSSSLKYWGKGTEGIENEIEEIIKKNNLNFEILRIDSESNYLKRGYDKKNKIIIGTQKAWSKINWNNIKLMVFLDADMTLFVPEYKMNEHLLYSMRDAGFKLSKESFFFVQTSQYEHRIFHCFENPINFYALELSERKKLLYPPYCFLNKFLIPDENKDSADKLSKKIKDRFLSLTEEQFKGKIYGPFSPVTDFQKGKFWKIILAKISYKSYKKDTILLANLIPENCKIDPNPNTMLTL